MYLQMTRKYLEKSTDPWATNARFTIFSTVSVSGMKQTLFSNEFHIILSVLFTLVLPYYQTALFFTHGTRPF